MTLKRKILVLISLLTFSIVLAMSGTYYYLFGQQIKQQSKEQISLAFELVFDDLTSRVQDLTHKIDTYIQTSIASALYVSQLFEEQYNETNNKWTVREIRKLMTYFSTIVSETRQFGELIEASEILLYNKDNRLIALYQEQEENNLSGIYLPQVFENQLIPVAPQEEWFTRLRELEDIPQQELPSTIPLQYSGDMLQSIHVTLEVLRQQLTLKFTAPITQRGNFMGNCVIYVAIRLSNIERYARLSKTDINIFTGKTWSLGTFPKSQTFPNLSLDALQTLNFQTDFPLPSIEFSEILLDEQEYYEGAIILGESQQLLGAIVAYFPYAFEEQQRNTFLIAILVIFLLFAVLTLGGATFLSIIIVRPITHLTQLIRHLAQGDLASIAPQTTRLRKKTYQAKDEVAQLITTFYEMLQYFQEMVEAAERISRGEIAQEFSPRSEKDILGKAFSQMTDYLNTIAAVATAVAEGDLRREISPKTESDVLGQAFHRMKVLRQTMSDIMKEATQLGRTSEDLNNISTQMASNAQQTSQMTHDLSSSSSQMSESVVEVSTATTQMAVNIREISTQTDRVAAVIDNAVKTAQSASSTISDLRTHSTEIGDIIKVITTIAQQTNLLALNATIEAARAGDSGKGFAVVAGEVKDLARETAKSAEDIIRKVETIQTSSHDAATAIRDMADNIEQVQLFSNTIVAAVTEQAATTDSITHNLTDAAHGAEMVSQSIADMAGVAQNSSEIAQTVQQSSEKQAMVAEHLQQLVERFKI